MTLGTGTAHVYWDGGPVCGAEHVVAAIATVYRFDGRVPAPRFCERCRDWLRTQLDGADEASRVALGRAIDRESDAAVARVALAGRAKERAN